MSNQKAILKVKNLSVEFPIFGGIFQRKIAAVHAVKNLSIELFKGETLGIVGESGSGKSTLGKAILNVLKLTAPEVKVTGEIFMQEHHTHNIHQHDELIHGHHIDNQTDLLSLSRKEMKFHRTDIQMIFQDPYSSLNPRMIVKDIIQEPLDIHTNMSNSEKKEKVEWLLDKVGLSAEQATRYPHEFSGGQRQRIGIARSLSTDPKIIIADEPVSALDVSIQAQIINLMMDLQEEFNLSIIFIAHDLSVVKHISNRIGVMYLGELVEINDTTEIFKNPVHDYTKTLLKAIPEPDPEGREKRKADRLSI